MDEVFEELYLGLRKSSFKMIIVFHKTADPMSDQLLLLALLTSSLKFSDEVTLASINDNQLNPELNPRLLSRERIINLSPSLNMDIDECFDRTSQRTLLVDDITSLFLINSEMDVFRYLYQLKRRFKRLFLLVKTSGISEYLMVKLKYLSDITINITTEPNMPRLNFSAQVDNYVSRKELTSSIAPKKLVRTCFSFALEDNGDGTVAFRRLEVDSEAQIPDIVADELPPELGSLPFNLRLSKNEKKNRDAITLPYMEAQDPKKSKIFYYPDKDDDFDEEDDIDGDLTI